MFTAQHGNGFGFGKPLILNPHIGAVMVGILLTPITLALNRRHEAMVVHVSASQSHFGQFAGNGADSDGGGGVLDDDATIMRIMSVPGVVVITKNKHCRREKTMQCCQSVTGKNGGVEILEEDDCQGKIMAIKLECGDHDNGVNGVVEGSKSTSQLIQNFNSAVGSYRFLFLRLSQPVDDM